MRPSNRRYFQLFALLGATAIVIDEIAGEDKKILSRRKRYLTFPEGSNFVITLSFIKRLMVNVPNGFITLGECDVPFKLPTDTRLYRKHSNMHYRHRRDLYAQLESAFNSLNLNGVSCMKRIFCEIEAYSIRPNATKSMANDLLAAMFTFPESAKTDDHKYADYCDRTTFAACNLPILDLILGTVRGD